MGAWVKVGTLRPVNAAAQASGSAATPLLGLGLSTNVTVTLNRAMPNANYLVEIFPATNLLGASKLEVASRSTTAVVVKVTAQGIALAAGSISVLAHY